MKSTGNTELDAVIKRYRDYNRRRAKRFAVLHWTLKVDYYDTGQAASNAMERVPKSRRAGIVDRQTGETWCNKPNYRPIMDVLRHREMTAPEHFRRVGDLALLKPNSRRKGYGQE